MKNLSNFNFKGKTVLLRSDLNSDIHKSKVLMSKRIKESAVTIKELKRKKAKVVVIAHQGRPGKNDFLSLKQHARLLNKFVKVKFIDDVVGKEAISVIKGLKNGDAVLLNNVRKLKDEFKPEKGKKNKLFRLVKLSDVYVNDAFSVCHRKHASVVLFPKYLKSCAGRLLEGEISALKKINVRKALFILGGAKPEENIRLLRGEKILVCGLFGQLCLIAKGKNLGAQNKYLKKVVRNYGGVVKMLRKKLKNVEMPVDFAVKIGGKRKEFLVDEFPSRYEIFDIGKETQEKYVKEIKKAKMIYMKGPAGYCADKKFCKGTIAVLKAVSKNKGFSLIGGGHLNDAIEMSGINQKKFGYVSLSGGALLRYVAGEKLVGLETLRS